MRRAELLFAALGYLAGQPLLDGSLVELDEDPLAAHLGRRNPGRRLARERHPPLLAALGIHPELARRVNARKADQRAHLPQPLDEHDACGGLRKAARHRNLPQPKVFRWRVARGMSKLLPLTPFQVDGIIAFATLSLLTSPLDRLPDLVVAVTDKFAGQHLQFLAHQLTHLLR